MKSINQQAKEYASGFDSNLIGRLDLETAFENGFKAAQDWISVEEELPDYYSVVLIKRTLSDGTYRYNTAWLSLMDDGRLTFTLNETNKIVGIENVPEWRPIEML
ncbi:hypothetical protein M2459_001362 [Parabacteroides sp. PF5-5]|uniref:hypothetical protein n=1 Tax=unclassified Parabacteroides TaxID=2649774 RepID=UPI002475B760|nr:MULTISPECIES: hypothetical protein [unclassified Parabacteroides]MDH6304627.1 hypothetical protein [Parabacteroides sp. PH5-39]MDH6315760.1 hypothetical protein [Parabacteroides sp. PF5-13]MDH6319419.1 hypothetical protein [Parabacteroides sp. PH5-13]MDH6323150.1 hypothetical protein [Parabacteroides sp. PH5-8]MDH6326952.1 hypothetical protein [Parabacteroides sp. PH5-41]